MIKNAKEALGLTEKTLKMMAETVNVDRELQFITLRASQGHTGAEFEGPLELPVVTKLNSLGFDVMNTGFRTFVKWQEGVMW
jgi:hypothetical protein